MLTNSQFAQTNKIATLSGDMEDFALFSLDLGDSKICVGRDENGKRIMKRANPHLLGKGIHLWEVLPARDLTATEIKAIEAKEAELDRLARIELYASRGWAFELPEEGEVDEAPQDEWEAFFADDVPMRGGRCSRKGGVRSHSGFEALVDNS